MRRSSELRETSMELQQELRRLAFPGDDSDERSQTVADDLRRYAEALSSASENAAVQSENLLSSTFLSADVGKLYLLPARAVGG